MKPTNLSFCIQSAPQNVLFGYKMLILTSKMVKFILEIICIFTAPKNYIINFEDTQFTPGYCISARSSLIVHLPISPQFSNFCFFQILIREFDLTITSVPQHLQSQFTTHFKATHSVIVYLLYCELTDWHTDRQSEILPNMFPIKRNG